MKVTLVMDDIMVQMIWTREYVMCQFHDTSDLPLISGQKYLESRNITPEQAAAILALAVDGGEGSSMGALQASLYEIAEKALVGLPSNLRPIP